MMRAAATLRTAALLLAASALLPLASAEASMVGTWEGRWYYSPEVVWKVPPPQSSYQMDIVITAETVHADGTESLLGHVDFYFPDNVLSQGPDTWLAATKNGFAVQFTNVANYDYQATLNFAGNEMLGLWYPSAVPPVPGVEPGCTPANVVGAYCGGFDLHYQPASVPEPAALGLLGVGLAGLLVRRRR